MIGHIVVAYDLRLIGIGECGGPVLANEQIFDIGKTNWLRISR